MTATWASEIRRTTADPKRRAIMAGRYLYTAHVTSKGEAPNWDALADDIRMRWAEKGRKAL